MCQIIIIDLFSKFFHLEELVKNQRGGILSGGLSSVHDGESPPRASLRRNVATSTLQQDVH